MRIGIDIVDIDRISALIGKYNLRFLGRIFSQRELSEWCLRGKRISLLAGRFAAKEAFLKAIKQKGISWKEIEILGEIPQVEFRKLNYPEQKIKLSISHTDKLAIATVIVE